MITCLKGRAIAMWLGVFISLGALCVIGAQVYRSDPLPAPFIDNQVHSIAASSDMWFKFDYGMNGTTRSIVTLTLVNGTGSGLRFQLWSPESIWNWWERPPIGKGTATSLDCDTHLPSMSGECRSGDLTWVGAFGAGGTYYVQVVNDTGMARDFLLVAQGTGLSLGPTPMSSPVAPGPIPGSATPVLTMANPVVVDDPGFAVPIDGQSHSIPGHSAAWFRFEYGGGSTTPRPIVFLRLVNGVQTGVRFEVWAGDLKNWWLQKPVGRGTQEILVNCFPPVGPSPTPVDDEPPPTEEPPTGHCPTNDLTWSGAFGAPGTYYVRVVNDDIVTVDYVLFIQ